MASITATARKAASSIRKIGPLTVSPFGIGTYRMGVKPFDANDPMGEINEERQRQHWKQCMIKSIDNGINLVDMASNYGSETIVKAAIS